MKNIKTLTLFILLISVLSSCATIKPIGVPGNQIVDKNDPTEINWPEEYEPENATFFVSNEIDIAAPPRTIWDILMKAEEWPSWYEGAFEVDVIDSDTLSENASFTWNTMGFDFTSEVTEFEPPYRLSWESRRGLIQGYHAWLIIPTETGSRVITDESQFGLLAHLQPIFVPDKLYRLHEIWLAELKKKAEAQ